MISRIHVFLLRTLRAWRYWRQLNYTWRLAWAKAGSSLGQLR